MDRANLKRDPKNQEALVNWWLFGTFTCTYHHISIFMYACCMCLFIHYANVHLEMMPCTVGSAPRPLRGLMKTGPMVEMFKTGSFQINSGASDQQVLNRSMVLPQCQSMVVGYNPKWFPSDMSISLVTWLFSRTNYAMSIHLPICSYPPSQNCQGLVRAGSSSTEYHGRPGQKRIKWWRNGRNGMAACCRAF